MEWMLNKKRVIEVRWTMENDSDTVKGPTEPHPHSPLHTYYVWHSATGWIPITIIITLQIFLISDFTQLSLPLSSSSPFLFSFNYYYPVLTLLSLSYRSLVVEREEKRKKWCTALYQAYVFLAFLQCTTPSLNQVSMAILCVERASPFSRRKTHLLVTLPSIFLPKVLPFIFQYIYINGFDSWSMILFAVKMLAGKSSYDSDSPNLAVTTSTATTTTTPTPEKVLVPPDGNASEDPLVCLFLVHVLHTTFMTQAVDSQFRVFCIWKQIMF